MPTYFYNESGSIIAVSTFAQQNGDMRLEFVIGTHVEHYRRKPDNAEAPRWFLRLIDAYIPVRESDVPREVRQSWVYSYERALSVVEEYPLYIP